MLKLLTLILLTCFLLVLASPALAYIGPGAGISVVGSLLSILATFFVAIGAILFWPLRKLINAEGPGVNPCPQQNLSKIVLMEQALMEQGMTTPGTIVRADHGFV